MAVKDGLKTKVRFPKQDIVTEEKMDEEQIPVVRKTKKCIMISDGVYKYVD